MFSPRLFALFALVAAAAALPADKPFPSPITTITEGDVDDSFPWFFPFGVSSLKNFFNPFFKLFPAFEENAPRIAINQTDFRVILNVNEYKPENLKVKVKGDFIIVQGSQEAKHEDHDLFASQFFHTYSLPQNSSAAAVTATLTNDKYLVVDAPIDPDRDGAKRPLADRDVPIVESGKPLDRSEPSPPAPAAPADTPAATTPAADREEVTDKDNDIPHGPANDIQA